MATINTDTTLIELATIISEALRQHDIYVVLSGGAAVSIYTDGEYQSKDLDFITSVQIRQLEEILGPIGFVRGSDRRHFVHPGTQWYIEFPAGPVQVGNAIVEDWTQMDTDFGVLLILSPTQMIMDRLAAYFHWNDQQSLEQALLIAMYNDIDWVALERWVSKEASDEKYAHFRALLSGST